MRTTNPVCPERDGDLVGTVQLIVAMAHTPPPTFSRKLDDGARRAAEFFRSSRRLGGSRPQTEHGPRSRRREARGAPTESQSMPPQSARPKGASAKSNARRRPRKNDVKPDRLHPTFRDEAAPDVGADARGSFRGRGDLGRRSELAHRPIARHRRGRPERTE